MIEFHLPIIPPKTTSQTKRLVMVAGKPRFFHKASHQDAESDLLTLCAPYTPDEPMHGPVALEVGFVFPWRKSEPRKERAQGWKYHTVRPDAGNLVKLLEDVLTKLQFWGDDSQVAHQTVIKYWGDKPGIHVLIRNI
jgi:Holliday junction resolvase RusA-like endonuclease